MPGPPSRTFNDDPETWNLRDRMDKRKEETNISSEDHSTANGLKLLET